MDSAPKSRFAWLQTWPGILTAGFFALIIFVALAYVEENWRGERVWAQTKAELEARGESFDRAKLIPPPVPDDQNFGTLDYFKTGSDGKTHIANLLATVSDKTPYSKENAKENKDKGYLPYLGNWAKGETVDAANVQRQLEDFLHHQTPAAPIPPGATPIDIFTKICPLLADLRQANAQRPLCRFNLDYSPPKPWLMKLGPIVDQIRVAKVLSYDSRLALLSHHPEIALQDSQVAWKIDSGLSQEPILVSGLVALGVVAIQLGVIEEGLVNHGWNDAQLAQIDDDLGKLDSLSAGQFQLRGDVTMSLVPTMDFILGNRSLLLTAMSGGMSGGGSSSGTFSFKDLEAYMDFETWEAMGITMFYTYMPSGWLRINEARNVRGILDGARAIDPAARRVDPVRVDALTLPKNGGSFDFFTQAESTLLYGVRKFAYSQAQVDMARIACRLERYRLAHGGFPASLVALVPVYGSELPHDVMNGQPYIYLLDKDGNYTLYSVGWNQKDDGGDIKSPGSASASYPSDQSNDWLWPNHVTKKK